MGHIVAVIIILAFTNVNKNKVNNNKIFWLYLSSRL